jgi:hypothetical protein
MFGKLSADGSGLGLIVEPHRLKSVLLGALRATAQWLPAAGPEGSFEAAEIVKGKMAMF